MTTLENKRVHLYHAQCHVPYTYCRQPLASPVAMRFIGVGMHAAAHSRILQHDLTKIYRICIICLYKRLRFRAERVQYTSLLCYFAVLRVEYRQTRPLCISETRRVASSTHTPRGDRHVIVVRTTRHSGAVAGRHYDMTNKSDFLRMV